ncbi:MAG: hypothetical protein KAX31_00690, partial [Thermoplasmata archaeon]|nr:hypothetical protein [Thermoplasmata archaeon]
MVFPTIESITPSSDASGTNHVVDYPGVVGAGDTLICFFTCDDNETVTFPGDWTVIYNEDAGNSGPTLAVAWKKAAGDEGGGSFIVTTGSTEASSSYLIRISGAADPTVDAPEATAEAFGNSATPTPIILTPGGGAKDYLWIAAEGNDDDDATTGWPANMPDDNLSHFGGSTVNLGMATVKVNAENFTPDTFSIAAAETWEAVTIAVYPAGVPPPPPPLDGSADLLGRFSIQHDGLANLLGVFSVRRDASTELLGVFKTARPGSA